MLKKYLNKNKMILNLHYDYSLDTEKSYLIIVNDANKVSKYVSIRQLINYSPYLRR